MVTSSLSFTLTIKKDNDLNMKIAILMSTYNGQKYLSQQIKSILNQSNTSWHLYIRDDGSEDNTCSIIREFAVSDERITFMNDGAVKNIGVVRSFMELLRLTKADFYMFSDQDDVWKKDKVENTLKKMLSCHYKSSPVCVHTNLLVVDRSLEPLNNGKPAPKYVWSSFQKLLFWNCVTGCTMMINQRLKEKINFKELNYNQIYMHDWWLALIAAEFGELTFLDEQTMLYRQHGDNVEGSLRQHSIMEIIHRMVHPNYDIANVNKIVGMANEFGHIYGKLMNEQDYQYAKEYGELVSRSSFLHNLALAIRYPPRERTKRGMSFFIWLMVVFHNDLNNSVSKKN